MLILFIWMNDSMAYLTGSFIGRTKFFPAISPKKTVEGTLGGILFTIAFAYVWGSNTDLFPVWHWIGFGLIASLMGTIGDLIESKLKRMAGIKDSGNLMPGHGGALDRFDSLLFAAPFAFLFALIFMACLQLHVF
jgi:phosphatidate cytidylyltransferase